MAKAPQNPRPRTIVLGDQAPPPEADQAEGAADEAASVMEMIRAAQSGGGVDDFKVRVYQFMGANKLGVAMPYVMSCAVDDIENLPEQLAQVAPDGGRFQVRVTRGGRMFKQFEVEVAPRPAGMLKQQPQQGSSDLSTVTNIMREMMEEQRRFVSDMLARNASAPPAGGGSVTQSLTEALSLMRTMQDLSPKPDPDIGLNMFNKGMEMAQKVLELGGGGGKGDASVLDIVRDLAAGEGGQKFLLSLADGMQRRQAPPPMQQPQRIQAPAQVFQPAHGQRAPIMRGPARPAPAPHQAAPNIGQPARSATPVKDAMEQIISEAKKGSDPGFVADAIEQQLPEGILNFLEKQPDIVAYLAGIDPRVNEHRAFFEAVIAAIWQDDDEESVAGGQDAEVISSA